jgi:hypothetical protein
MGAGLRLIRSVPGSNGFFWRLESKSIFTRFKFYADAEVPIYQNFTSNQQAASVLIKATIAYEF